MRAPDVARSRRTERRLEAVAEDLGDRLEELQHAPRLSRCDVHRLAAEPLRPRGLDVRFDHIRDVGEVARLTAVVEYDRPLAPRVCAYEEGDRGGVRGRRVLARTEHVEVTQAHRAHA